ncbi:hypothetical protein M406DRAFT_321284 [Cryphonectria parasitica EP155]|uniref:Transcription factor domain-containing protein n=1 Tax=Cryphonectria parasitica (strain ATCC 38755 / EP155) TaxID=660469 RepID=A0A9P4Y5C2_CRYP1|nr:uncharacterized protein M406DRAFT_321284 [Cryphonectria parasitica EP155]KAF3766647.1 hypothetical protein M406DRAFT_321284 [Cryphonectria parasitica EP155]
MTLTPLTGRPAVGGTQQVSSSDQLLLDGALAGLPGQDFVNLGGDFLGWNNAGINLPDFLDTHTDDSYLSPESPNLFQQSVASAFQPRQGLSTPESSIPATPSIPNSPTSTVRSLVQRPNIQRGTQRVASLILHTLKSYPVMMLRHNALPPFVHPYLLSLDIESVHMEPLTNCISLVHMISSDVRGSRNLFWKNVRMECERVIADYQQLSRWGLLAAIQALSIYVLIRLNEGETEHNNVDFLLVRAVTLTAQQLTRSEVTCHTQCASCNKGLQTSWEEWIFRESRRRLAVVYRVVNMLIYFEPGALCNLPSGLVLAPLPARRQLWEAADGFAWKTESQKEPGLQISFGLARDGELVKVDEGRLSCSDAWLSHDSGDAENLSRSIANWEDWCSGMDAFGGLVMLAASLIS